MGMTSVLTPIAIEQGSAAAAPLLTRPLVVVCAVNVTAMLAFYLLLAVVPSHAAAGGLGSLGAGVTAGAMMLAAVAAELAAPQLIGRYGYRAILAGGLVLLGGPALALPVVTGLPELTGISVVRGVGFASWSWRSAAWQPPSFRPAAGARVWPCSESRRTCRRLVVSRSVWCWSMRSASPVCSLSARSPPLLERRSL